MAARRPDPSRPPVDLTPKDPVQKDPAPDAAPQPPRALGVVLAGVRATAGRPAGALAATRWLFVILALVSLAITLPVPLVTAATADGLILLASGLVLGASWTVSYLAGRTGLVADVVDTVAVFAFALASDMPSSVLPVLISGLWFRSLYGPTWRVVLRPILFSVALGAAVVVWPSVLGHTESGEALHVVASLPMLFLTVVVAQRLAVTLAERERRDRIADVYAKANADLIGLTDDAAIRQVAARNDEGLCAAVPGLRIAKVDLDAAADADDVVVIAMRGPWADRPGRLPASLVGVAPGGSAPAAPGAPTSGAQPSAVHPVVDTRLLDDAAGQPCAWLVLSLPLVDRLGVRSWLVVGAPGGVPRPVIRALQNLANHMALAYAVAEAHSELTERATTDALTGLANRAAFTVALTHALRSDTFGEVSVLFVDMNDFKEINDHLGHDAGDQVLREVGSRLSRASREGDVCARLGGDEFAVLLPGAGEAAAQDAARRVSDAVAAPLRRADDVPVPLSASVGWATVPTGSDPEELLRRADAAMYAAKRARG